MPARRTCERAKAARRLRSRITERSYTAIPASAEKEGDQDAPQAVRQTSSSQALAGRRAHQGMQAHRGRSDPPVSDWPAGSARKRNAPRSQCRCSKRLYRMHGKGDDDGAAERSDDGLHRVGAVVRSPQGRRYHR